MIVFGGLGSLRRRCRITEIYNIFFKNLSAYLRIFPVQLLLRAAASSA